MGRKDLQRNKRDKYKGNAFLGTNYVRVMLSLVKINIQGGRNCLNHVQITKVFFQLEDIRASSVKRNVFH